MGKIKSALELAMEKTADLKVDKNKIKENNLKKEGQILASAVLNKKEKDGISKLKSYSKADYPSIVLGYVETIISNIHLPLYVQSDNNLAQLEEAFSYISKKKEIYQMIFKQLDQLFTKYIDDIQNLSNGLKEQYMPVLRQKQQQYMEQTGKNIQIEPEQDPEFMEILTKNKNNLQEQYEGVIKEAKEELKRII